VPALVLLVGPGLYLLYLSERQLTSQNPGRANKILKAKSIVDKAPKCDALVTNARTLSLLAIALGFVAVALGTFNNQRSTLFADARSLIV